ncbi:Chitin binding domain [Trinorchestia longiramus]|nr:Chitin binding domain [Trinorchestia longiramus]
MVYVHLIHPSFTGESIYRHCSHLRGCDSHTSSVWSGTAGLKRLYRCHDRYSLGFYIRAYFECETGTVFSDALDQCVFGYVNDDCSPITLSTPQPVVTIQPPIAAPPVACYEAVDRCSSKFICPSEAPATQHAEVVDVCKGADWRCSNGTSTPLCPSGFSLSKAKQLCLPGEDRYSSEFTRIDQSFCQLHPRPEGFSLVCEDIVDNCTDTYVCLARDAVPQLVRRCDVVQVCSRGGKVVSRRPVCQDGYDFDPHSNQCSPRVAAYAGCAPSVQVRPAPPPPQCTQQAEYCKELDVCEALQQTALVCRQVFSCDPSYGTTLLQAGYPEPGPACVNIQDSSCTVETSDCWIASFCPAGISSSIFVPKLQVCKSAVEVCSGSGSRVKVCQEGEVYDVQNLRCTSSTELCASVVRPLAPIVCEDVVENCLDDVICSGGTGGRQVVRTCDLITVCYQNGSLVSRSPVCPPGSKFDASSNQCIHTPPSGNCPSLFGTVPKPTVPNCSIESETCAVLPVCNGVDSALVCRRYFSCLEPLTGAIFQSPAVSSSLGASCIDFKPDLVSEKCPSSSPLSLSDCKDETLCPTSWNQSSFVVPVQVCLSAGRPCSDGSVKNVCAAGEVFLPSQNLCIPGSEICQLEPRRNSTIVCEDLLERCVDWNVCRGNRYEVTVVRKCYLSRVCSRNGVVISRNSLCPDGHYDPGLNKCTIDSSVGFECSPNVVTQPPPAPVCRIRSEVCSDICRSELSALSCHHIFSCEPPLSTTIAERTAFFPQLSEAQECEMITSLLPDPAPSCSELKLAQCKSVSLCPVGFNSSSPVATIEVCSDAVFVCEDGSSFPACVAGQIYSVSDEQCIQDEDCMKQIINSTSHNSSFNVECTKVGEIPLKEEIKKFYCNNEAMCKPSGSFVEMRWSCKEFYKCEVISGVLTPVLNTCPDGQVLEVSSETCIPAKHPDYIPCGALSISTDTEMPEIQEISSTTTTTTTTTTTIKPTSELFPQEFNTTLVCTRDKEIPLNEDVLRINCDPVPLCNEAGVFQGNQLLCTRFYVCRWDPVKSHFYLEDSVCSDPSKLFSYESGSCVFPANACRI